MAISNTYTVTISDGKAILNEDIYLSMGDDAITLNLKVQGLGFDISGCNNAEYNLMSPNGDLITITGTISNNIFTMNIAKSLIDDLEEVGDYALQIIVTDGTSRLSLPIIANQFHVKPSLKTITDNDGILPSNIDNTHVSLGDISSEVFNEDLSYNATTWNSGDTITTGKMNKIEKALSYLMDVDVKPVAVTNDIADLAVEQKQVLTFNNDSGIINLPSMTGCAYANMILLVNCAKDCKVTFSSDSDNQTIKLVQGYHFVNLIYYTDWIITC